MSYAGDLVKALRAIDEHECEFGAHYVMPWVAKAADELERLQGMVEHASAQGVTFPPRFLPKISAPVVVVDPVDGSQSLAYDPDAENARKN